MKFSVLLHGNNINNNVNQQLVTDCHPATSKLERLPEYFRDTMEWFLGCERCRDELRRHICARLCKQMQMSVCGPMMGRWRRGNVAVPGDSAAGENESVWTVINLHWAIVGSSPLRSG
uniref:Uncharacterized protein n=1 Tax=Plectus sambesii TaxID=2011161 RepID=A0A914WV56_9BILA